MSLKFRTSVLAGAILCGAVQPAQAQENWTWTPWVTIEMLSGNDLGIVADIPVGAADNPNSSCPQKYTFNKDIENYETISAVVMLAYSMNKAVKIKYDANSNFCNTPSISIRIT